MKELSRWFIVVLLVCLCSSIAGAQGSVSWSSGAFRLEVTDNTVTVFHDSLKLALISCIKFNFARPTSTTAAASENLLTLKCTYPAAAKYGDESGELTALIEVTRTGEAIRFRAAPAWARNTTIEMADGGEHFFGVLEPLYPENRKSPDLRGEVVDVDILGDASQYHENYASAWSAFTMTNKGYASFFDTFAAGRYRLGINGTTELYHHTGALDWYIIAGKNGDEILRTYYTIIGRPKFVPLWACGPIAWRDENKGGKDEVLADIRKMTDLKIPFTGWFVDRPYSHGAEDWSKMDFNERFANPGEWIATIRNTYGLQCMTWVAPATFADKDFPGLLPGIEGYMDLSDSAAVREFGRRLKEHQYAVGVRGHKMDRADQLFPVMYPWHDTTPAAERRNKYLYLFAKTVDEFLRESWGDDQVNFARAAFHRCQPSLSAVWGGDSRSTWDGMAANLANAMRCSFMGFPVWGSDVGGYLGGRIPEDLYARWLQLGSWSGLFEVKLDDAGGKREDRPPWKYSERLQKIFRECNDRRMEMQPFIYSLVNTSYKNGAVMKPLAYSSPEDAKTYSLWDEFTVGKTFLVAPVLDSTGNRTVYFPRGTWHDFYNMNKTYQTNTEVHLSYPLEQIPVFVRANSIWVTGVCLAGNAKIWSEGSEKRLRISALPGGNGENTVFDYIDYFDGNKEKPLSLSCDGNTVTFTAPALASDANLTVKLDKSPAGVTLNRNRVEFIWDKELHAATVELKKGEACTVEIRLERDGM